MIIKPSTNGLFSMTLQADFKAANECYVYTMSKDMLRVKRENTPQLSVVHIEFSSVSLGIETKDYYTDANGALEIPLRNLVNKCYDNGDASVTMDIKLYDLDGTDVDGWISIACYIMPGVSRYDRRVPVSPYPQNKIYVIEPFREILPPTVMCIQTYGGVNSVDQLFSGIVVESTLAGDHNGAWSWSSGGAYTPINVTGTRQTTVVVSNRAQYLRITSGDANYDWELKRLSYFNCQDAVVVRWTSLTGSVRQHWFPVVGYVNDTDKEVSMLSAGDGYKVRKNATLGLKCRLTGLTAYDCWYYQDMMQSSDVHAICRSRWQNLPPFLTAIQSTLTACQVEGGMPQTPDGNGFFTFEFTIKTKHYDTI